MEKLLNKRFNNFDYPCRYTSVPYFYDSETQKEIYGIIIWLIIKEDYLKMV
jgi:hypothetical protein